MNKDAQIAEIIIDTFCDWGIPVLPIHDSYIVPEGCEDDLISTMCNAFEKVMGIPLTGLEQNAIKEKSDGVEYLEGILMSWIPYDEHGDIEKRYIESRHPTRSERYIYNLNMFSEWMDINAKREDKSD